MTEGIIPPETEGMRRRRRRRRIALVTMAAVLVAGGIWGGITVLGICGSLDPGVRNIDGECVGVTDGSYVFHSELGDIQRLIAEKNEKVRVNERGYVSVALLDPLTPTEESALPQSAVRHRLEGAYTALRRVNNTQAAGNMSPQVELLLANQGSTDDQWQHVLEQLRERSTAEEHPLLAVVGLGVSTARTKQQAEQLAELGIPMVGAVLTADDLEYDNVRGLIKTSPSNRHYVGALRHYLDSTALDSAIMVRDSNSDKGIDLYTRSLEREFAKQMEHVLEGQQPQQFTGRSGATGAPPSLFDNVQANICAVAGEDGVAILYAGREIDLPGLLESLANRACAGIPLTVLTAGVELGKVLKDIDLRAAKLTVLNAATVDPEGWGRKGNGTPRFYDKFRSAFVEEFPEDHLRDGGAIMTHDALLTASRAIRMAAPDGFASHLTPEVVLTQLLNINTQYEVNGASGTLQFSKEQPGEGTGIPEGKPIPVLRYPHPTDQKLESKQVWLCTIETGPGTLDCGP